MAASRDRFGITRRFPIGPIAAISPFNFPLNLAAHKLSPAIASGNPIVLKPPSKDPLVMLRVAEIIAEAGLPDGAVSVLPMSRELGDRMVADERFKLLTFTGSPAVGWRMKERAGKKKVVLELGGNAGVIVDQIGRPRLGHPPRRDGRVRLQRPGAASASSGCSCTRRCTTTSWRGSSRAPRDLRQGDPSDASTDVGPMVDEANAARTSAWVDEAIGGQREGTAGRGTGSGTFFPPTVLTNVPPDREGVLERGVRAAGRRRAVHGRRRGDRAVNDSTFGLQCGVFTSTSPGAWTAFNELEVGGVIVNDVPTYRVDHMPYGGVKDSGLGREGLRWAIEDMTEIRLMVLAWPQ